mgnify:CR=1 FL=1
MKTVPFLAVSVFIIPHSVQKCNGILKFFQSAVVFVAFAQVTLPLAPYSAMLFRIHTTVEKSVSAPPVQAKKPRKPRTSTRKTCKTAETAQ